MILPLWPLLSQFQYRSGANLVAGKVYIFYQGRTRLAPVYKNEQGIVGPNPIILDADGRGPCFVDSNYTYTVVVTDARGKELFSQDMSVDNAININDALDHGKIFIINSDGTISISATSGADYVRYDLGTFNKPLGVQAPLFWAQDDEECSIIGASGLATSEELADVSAVVDRKIDTTAAELALSGKLDKNEFTAYQEDIDQAFSDVSTDIGFLSGAINNKLDTSSFADVSGDFLTAHQSLEGYLQNSDLEISDNKITGISGIEIKGADLPEDVMTEDKFSYDGYKISAYNGSAFVGQGGGGSTYSAGDYIDITDDVISVTGLQPSGDYVVHDELTAYATQDDLTGLATKDELADKLDESAFANVSGSFYTTANVSGFITNDDLAPYQLTADMTAYQTVEDMTAYQPVGNYQTAGNYYSASNPSGFITNDAITGLQPSGDYATHDDLTGYVTTGDLSTVSAEITAMIPSGEYELCAGSGIELTDDPIAKTTTISVTAQGGNPEVEAEVIAHSADWNTVGDKLDTTAFSTVSGDFYTTANESGFITGIPDTYLQNTDLTLVDNKITEISGIPLSAGDELPESVSAATDYITANSAIIDGTIETVSSNSGVWGGEPLPISSRDGIDLELTGDMLWIGASSINDSITGLSADKLDVSAFSDVSGTFLTSVPDTYLQNTDLEISDNKITGISGVPLAAGGGGDVPEGVMAESGLEYNAVNEISGYNGSAIAQYGAEKQWLTHDDTLTHISNSAQYALGVNIPNISADLAKLLGVDETVLFETTGNRAVNSGTFSEPLSSFKYIDLYANRSNQDNNPNLSTYARLCTINGVPTVQLFQAGLLAGESMFCPIAYCSLTNTTFNFVSARNVQVTTTGTTFNIPTTAFANIGLQKAVGIGRKN